MSRLGKLPVVLPNGVSARIEKNQIVVKGPKGELKQTLHDLAMVEVSEKEIKVSIKKKAKNITCCWVSANVESNSPIPRTASR